VAAGYTQKPSITPLNHAHIVNIGVKSATKTRPRMSPEFHSLTIKVIIHKLKNVILICIKWVCSVSKVQSSSNDQTRVVSLCVSFRTRLISDEELHGLWEYAMEVGRECCTTDCFWCN